MVLYEHPSCRMLRVNNERHLLLGSLVCNPRRVDESSVPEVPRVKGVWINERFVSMLMLVLIAASYAAERSRGAQAAPQTLERILVGGSARCVESEKVGRG